MNVLLHTVVNAWWLPVLLAAGIVWWAQNSFRKFKSKIEPLKAAVRRATGILTERETSRDFTRDYEIITALIADDSVLGATWLEFESTLILPVDNGYVRNTRRPSEYFNDSIYYKGGVNLRDFESVPNQLVGAGLLFTFVGLVISLLIAKTGMRRS